MSTSKPPKDKRTKEFKTWAANHEKASSGLGDQVEKVTKATGIKKAVEFFADGRDCGCDKRKEILNELFPSKKPECFTEEEFTLMQMAIDTKKVKFSGEETKEFTAIYNRVFKQRVECIPCSFKNTVWKQLVKVYNQYI
tara:strand:+ start:204 stop:620 length:417 start_codon:yes stop_codon:yes gene_type:complete